LKELAALSVNLHATSGLPVVGVSGRGEKSATAAAASGVGAESSVKRSAGYEQALKVLAQSAKTSVAGLEQFRMNAKK
jgi:hypothetical protein